MTEMLSRMTETRAKIALAVLALVILVGAVLVFRYGFDVRKAFQD